MSVLFLTALAWGQQTVVAVGEREASASNATLPGGWVRVLADCLEERKPSEYEVVDRRVVGETLTSLKERAADIAKLEPSWVVVSLGALPERTEAQWSELLTALIPTQSGGLVVLPAAAPDRAKLAGQLRQIVAARERLIVLDPYGAWPTSPDDRRALINESDQQLTDQGYAKVASSMCDALLEPKKEP